MSDNKPSLGLVAARGAVWLVAQNAGGRVVGFLSQLVVAAILLPADFGVIGLAYTISTFGSVLTNFGMESVLVQRQKTIRLWLVPAFWFSLGLGLLGFLLVLAVGPIAARMYDTPQVSSLAAIIAISIPITALSTIPTVLMRARMQFGTMAAVSLAETLLIQALTIGFAMLGYGAYAFALPLPMVAIARTITMWVLSRPDLSGLFSKIGRLRYLMNSSLAVFATGIVQSAINQGSYVILGVFGTPTAVGIYFFAFKMASQPLLLLAMSLCNVLFPALSHLRNSPVAQAEAAFRAARLLGIVIMPLAFLQAGVIGPAIHIFFASKWNDSIPIMQILSVALGFDAIAWIAGTLVTAQGGFRRQLIYVLAFAPPFFVLVGIGGWNGSAMGVALGVAAYYGLVTPIYSYVVFRKGGIGLLALLGIYLRPAALSAVAVGVSVWLVSVAQIRSDLVQVFAISAGGVLFYAALLRLMDVSAFNESLELGRKMLARRSSRAAAA